MELQLQQLRKKAGFKSRKAFSDASGIPERQVKAWEYGERNLYLEDACKIADFLDVSLDELAGRWDYVGRYSDERQREMNETYSYLGEEQKDAALGAVLGVAAVQARKKAGSQGPETRAKTA